MANELGVGLSPIPAEETLEDLPRLLARLASSPQAGLRRLPRPRVRGALPGGIEKLFEAFLADPTLGGIVPVGGRPDIGEVIAPEQPVVAEPVAGVPGGGDVFAGEPDIVSELIGPGQAPVGGAEVEAPGPAGAPEVPSYAGPGEPTSGEGDFETDVIPGGYEAPSGVDITGGYPDEADSDADSDVIPGGYAGPAGYEGGAPSPGAGGFGESPTGGQEIPISGDASQVILDILSQLGIQ